MLIPQVPKLIPNHTTQQHTQLLPTNNTHLKEERIDPKLGGHHNNKIAFIRNRDIWVMDFDGNETQLTFCSLDTTDPTLNCGGVEYMMQVNHNRKAPYDFTYIDIPCIIYRKNFIVIPDIIGHHPIQMNQQKEYYILKHLKSRLSYCRYQSQPCLPREQIL